MANQIIFWKRISIKIRCILIAYSPRILNYEEIQKRCPRNVSSDLNVGSCEKVKKSPTSLKISNVNIRINGSYKRREGLLGAFKQNYIKQWLICLNWVTSYRIRVQTVLVDILGQGYLSAPCLHIIVCGYVKIISALLIH